MNKEKLLFYLPVLGLVLGIIMLLFQIKIKWGVWIIVISMLARLILKEDKKGGE